ncbi:hypothetical protein QBC34DRAFT_386956 [Podospora aff. communis PSN243]|uniref:Uncharacterized protein n=1 Tax=Podospora aff. communis PSN243 TaxID=3040156 RepID=A0AAV9G460_9PEZI|nr:hypothetical protein QBC34DRAFT_386956 [Podospora aff. communis PSN243]
MSSTPEAHRGSASADLASLLALIEGVDSPNTHVMLGALKRAAHKLDLQAVALDARSAELDKRAAEIDHKASELHLREQLLGQRPTIPKPSSASKTTPTRQCVVDRDSDTIHRDHTDNLTQTPGSAERDLRRLLDRVNAGLTASTDTTEEEIAGYLDKLQAKVTEETAHFVEVDAGLGAGAKDIHSAVTKLTDRIDSGFEILHAELIKLRRPLSAIRNDLQGELTASKAECSKLQGRIDRMERLTGQGFLRVAVKMLGSEVVFLGSPAPSALEVASLISTVQLRGVANPALEDYINGGDVTRNSWYCVQKLIRHGALPSRVNGERCDCGGGVAGEGDAPCVLMMRRDGFPVQFAFGPVPPTGM